MNLTIEKMNLLLVALCNHEAIIRKKLSHPNENISLAIGLESELEEILELQKEIRQEHNKQEVEISAALIASVENHSQ
jgi:radical SAM superfamily enzyme YgiQ (UPF0313 family)